MAHRFTIRAFQGTSKQEFCEIFQRVIERYGGKVSWEVSSENVVTDLRLSHSNTVTSLSLPYLSGACSMLCNLVGAELDRPWIELRVQEGTHWDYSLSLGKEGVHNFSVWPEYWGGDWDYGRHFRGNPLELAQTWGVPLDTVENYLRQWGMTWFQKLKGRPSKGKAYPDDEFEYGDIFQVFDFLSKLGGTDPMNLNEHGEQHSIDILPSLDSLRAAINTLE